MQLGNGDYLYFRNLPRGQASLSRGGNYRGFHPPKFGKYRHDSQYSVVGNLRGNFCQLEDTDFEVLTRKSHCSY